MLAVSGLGCGCVAAPVMAGLGTPAPTSKFDAPPSTYTSLTGLTPSQIAKVTELRVRHITNAARAFWLLGREAPEVSFLDVLSLDARKLASTSEPALLVRSVLLYAIARTGQLIERLPLMFRAQNLGISGAAGVAGRLVALSATGIVAVGRVLDLIPAPATSGLGFIMLLPLAALAVPLLAVVYFLHATGDTDAETEATCAAQLRATGTPCTAADFARYSAQHTAEDQSALDKIIDKMGDTAGSVIKFVLVGVGVLILGVVAYNYVSYRVGRAVMKSPTGRKLVGAAVGGPAGAALVSNRKRSSRRRRTSRSRR